MTTRLWRGVRRPFASLLERSLYRPELHYMRGPGPATRAKAGLSVR